MRGTQRLMSLLTVAVAAFAAASCGSSSDDGGTGSATSGTSTGSTRSAGGKVKLAMSWNTYVPYDAPIVVAQKKGFFKEEGVDVEMSFTPGSRDASLAVAEGRYDMGWVDLSTAAAARLSGVPITGVATVQGEGATALVVKADSGIEKPADLKGRTIGSTPTGSDATLLPAFLAANGLSESDVTVANMPANGKLAALISGKVDAINGVGYYYEAALADQGIESNQLLYADYNMNVLDKGFIANDDFLGAHGERITAFLRAYKKGLDYTIENPDEACDVMVAEAGEEIMTPSLCAAQLEGFISLLPDPSAQPWGSNPPELWSQTVDVLKEYGGVEGDTPVESMSTDDLLP